MSFDEQPDSHCACCRAWEERVSGLKGKLRSAATIIQCQANEAKAASAAADGLIDAAKDLRQTADGL